MLPATGGLVISVDAGYARIYTGPDGESHFEDVTVPLEKRAGGAVFFIPEHATGMFFLTVEHWESAGWHNPPRNQFLIWLEGRSEMEVSDGARRKFGPGDVVLVNDLTGRGHITRSVSRKPQRCLVVTAD
jgi:hypothetical protein